MSPRILLRHVDPAVRVPRLLLIMLLLAGAIPGAAVSGQSPRAAGAAWDTISVDVAIDRVVVAADGTTVDGSSSHTAYRREQSHRGGRWTTVVTTLSPDRPSIVSSSGTPVTIENPFEVARYEDDGDGSPPRYFNARGEPLPGPDPNRKRLTRGRPAPEFPEELRRGVAGAPGEARHGTGKEALDTLVLKRADSRARRDRLVQAFGPPVGKIKGLTRFVRIRGADVDEVLVDDGANVPMEANTARNGVLARRATYKYTPWGADGDLMRTQITNEQLLPGGDGQRAAVQTTFTNLRLLQRR